MKSSTKKIQELQPYIRSLQDLISFSFFGQEAATRLQTFIDVITKKNKVSFKTLSQLEEFIKQRFTPSFQHQVQRQKEPLTHAVVQQPEIQHVFQEHVTKDIKISTSWKENDNCEFRLSSLNKMLDVLTSFETSIFNESKTQSEYVERLYELVGGFKMIFQQMEDEHHHREEFE